AATATKKAAAPKMGTTRAVNAGASEETVTLRAKMPKLASVGAGLALYQGRTGLSVGLTASTQVMKNTPIFVGLDTGVNYYNNANGLTSQAGIPLLPSAFYRFTFNDAPGLHPYMGISMGAFVWVSGRNEVNFEYLFRPGLDIQVAKNVAFNFESKFGV